MTVPQDGTIRVLIVDDSATIRQLLKEIIGGEAHCEVVGLAGNGEEAVRLARQHRPDIVTMDLRMPGMNGYEALPKMLEVGARVIIISGAEDQEQIRTAVDMMRMGAVAVLPKPQVGESIQHFVQRVRDTVTELAYATTQTLPSVRALLRASANEVPVEPQGPADGRIVLFGGSTGAPGAMIEVLRGLPVPFPLPIVIAQHIAPGFVGGMADWLSRDTGHTVRVARNGEVPQVGHVYLLPVPDGLKFVRGFQFASPRPGELPAGPASIAPSIDLLFLSAAEAGADRIVAVLFSGMGKDGVAGMEQLLDGGAVGLVQDPVTCVVPGIPGAAVERELKVASQNTSDLAASLRVIASRSARQSGDGPSATNTPEDPT